MNQRSTILGVGTSVPKYRYTRQDIEKVAETWLGADPKKHELFNRFLKSSKTDQRFFSIPSEEILSLNGLHGRQVHFEREGPALGENAIIQALANAQISTSDIETLLFTSCSCPPIPSIDAVILERAGLKRTTNRIPIYQHGCAAGVIGLGIASKLAKSNQIVALNSVELCSLVFNRINPNPAELVGSALFGDGAACVLVGLQTHGLQIVAHESFLIPETRHLMGYNLEDDGFHLRLDPELPSILTEVAPQRVNSFLSKHGTSVEEIQHWLFHPGSIKILNFLEEAFSLKASQAPWARQVLSEFGNLSSATVLFVLQKFLQTTDIQNNEFALMIGVGPGLTIELILFQYIQK